MSGDPEQEYFADGMVEEITTEIARLPWLSQIARNSSFTYKGRAVDVPQVARELGVRYVLEGSVRKAGDRIRIVGQLIDAATGAHIWADRFDGTLENIFELQDLVASSVAGAIEPKLRRAEIERASRKPVEHLDVYDLYLRALARFHRFTGESLEEAVVLLRRALAIDPSYAPAAALVAQCHYFLWIQGWGRVSADDLAEDVRLAREALETGRDDADSLWRAAYTLFSFAGEIAMAEAILDRALALNPNGASAWGTRGWVHTMRNQPEAAVAAFERALRLSPFDPLGCFNSAGLAAAHLVARRFEKAIEWADRALNDQPRSRVTVSRRSPMPISAASAERAPFDRLLAVSPQPTIADWRAFSAPSVAPEVQELYVTGLRLAGLPEE